jgi:hypothetical protein
LFFVSRRGSDKSVKYRAGFGSLSITPAQKSLPRRNRTMQDRSHIQFGCASDPA